MFEIAYRTLKDPLFGAALGALTAQTNLPVELKLRVMRIFKKVHEARAEALALYDEILLEFAEKDEKGRPVLVPETPGALKVPAEKTEALSRKLDEFYALSATVDLDPVPFEPLAGPLSPRDILLLAPIFGMMDEQTPETSRDAEGTSSGATDISSRKPRQPRR